MDAGPTFNWISLDLLHLDLTHHTIISIICWASSRSCFLLNLSARISFSYSPWMLTSQLSIDCFISLCYEKRKTSMCTIAFVYVVVVSRSYFNSYIHMPFSVVSFHSPGEHCASACHSAKSSAVASCGCSTRGDGTVASSSSVTSRVFTEINDVIFHEVWALQVME